MDNNEKIELSESISPSKTSSSKNRDESSLTEQEILYNERYQKDTKWRDKLSCWVIVTDSLWLIFVAIVLCVNGSKLPLSDSVLIMLLGTTTANVLGLAYIVLKGQFSNNTHSKPRKD